MSATAANPYRRKGLLAYSPRVLLALQQAIGGSKDFFQWLVEAGYTELAAFSNFLQDDVEAEQWLVQHNYHWLGLLSHAIDGDPRCSRTSTRPTSCSHSPAAKTTKPSPGSNS